MNDEDFGFARRDNRALTRVPRGPEFSSDEGQSPEKKDVSSMKSCKKNCRGGGGASFEERGSPTAAPPLTTTAASTNVPQSKRPSSGSSSVPTDAPHIPNVVEYHLKVKPCPRVYRLQDFSHDRQTQEMKKDLVSPTDKKDVVSKLSCLSIDKNVFEGSTDLPQVFQVKYLGSHDARGLWGIKHTRQPVDNMVASAKALPTNTMLPLIKLVVSRDGVALLPLDKRKQEQSVARMYPIETISYGVQDLVYTRVFSMIVVRDTDNFRRISPFECHAFVCESKYHARQLTYALAAAFEFYSRMVKSQNKSSKSIASEARERFAIDLRSPEEIEADLCRDSEA